VTSERRAPRLDQSTSITRAPSHPQFASGYFSGKKYRSKQEICADVKQAVAKLTNVDLDEYPIIDFILSHPENARSISMYYNVQGATISEAIANKK
jgi:hypothetical protein